MTHKRRLEVLATARMGEECKVGDLDATSRKHDCDFETARRVGRAYAVCRRCNAKIELPDASRPDTPEDDHVKLIKLISMVAGIIAAVVLAGQCAPYIW